MKVLELAQPDAEVLYWRAFLSKKEINTNDLTPGMVFPFRPETGEVLNQLVSKSDHWLPRYHLGLLQWSSNNIDAAKKLFDECGNAPTYAPFYAVRAKLYEGDKALTDLQKARELDKKEWRYGRALVNHYILNKQFDKARTTADAEYKNFPDNYVLGMLYARTLILKKEYANADKILSKIEVLPNEGSTIGRQLYKETKLMLAVENMKAGNCKKALQYVTDSKLWPERLGSGKPYDGDIDTRLEDWLSYECLVKTKNSKTAKQMLDKIITYKPGKEDPQPSVNTLVTAWALKQSGRAEEAEKLLNDIVAKNPSNKIAKWTLDAYHGNESKLDVESNESYDILQQLMANK